jgi:guanylate kinase
MAGRGRLVVVSAPSGAGKTTIATELLRRIPTLRFSVSATTRARRPNEIDGRDYFFLSRAEFERRVADGAFVEWEELYGDLYGTLKSEVDKALAEGTHMLFDVDVKGGLSIKRLYAEALLLFIRPPSPEVLAERLHNRHTESDDALRRRLARVPMELELGKGFDRHIINDNLQRATDEAQSIVQEYLAAKE